MSPLRVACFGLQGFGNDLLLAVQGHPRAAPVAMHTRPERFPFGYYACEPVPALAARLGVPVVEVPAAGDWDCVPADLAIVSSFHRILRPAHLARYGRVVNIHPSLLPAYRGPTPTNWAVRDGQRVTGLTAHLVDEGIDTGPAILRRPLLNPLLPDHELRRALAFLSRELVAAILDAWPDLAPLPDEGGAPSYQPARRPEDAVLRVEALEDVDALVHHIKAFTNYPMPRLAVGDREFVVDYAAPRESLELTVGGRRFSVLGYWAPPERDRPT